MMKKVRKSRDRIVALALAVCLGVSATSLAIVSDPRSDGLGWAGQGCFDEYGTATRSTRECCYAKCGLFWTGTQLVSCASNCSWEVGHLRGLY